MRVLAVSGAVAVALGACSTANDMADDLARGRAKAVVNGYVADRYPGLNSAPVTDCIIDAADAREILQIAGAAVTGLDAGTAEQISRVARRPEALQCIAQNGPGLLG